MTTRHSRICQPLTTPCSTNGSPDAKSMAASWLVNTAIEPALSANGPRARRVPATNGHSQYGQFVPGRAEGREGELMQTDVVTGAFGYSGAAIARELRAAGHQVRTLTGHPRSGPGAGDIDTRPLDFSDPEALVKDLTGAHTLYCTYWVRFPHGTATRASAVANSEILFDAAARAGVARIVYVSILHADTASPYPYFSGKGEVERHLAAIGVPYAIARPSILFGSSAEHGAAASVLVNNIAWLLRRLPVFGIGDGGGYRVRPIHVDDLARLLVKLGGQDGDVTVDAVGPDAPTFREMVSAIRAATGSRSLLVPAPGWLIPPLAAVLGAALRDVLLTPEEYQAMADGLATSDAQSTGQSGLMEWIASHGDELGRVYANELDRHYRSPSA
jgi:uncharacterized protein YbjT (DUF2867 family)